MEFADCAGRQPFGEASHPAPEVVLDTRDLPMIGEIGRTLASMEALPPGHRLRHVSHMVSWPLLAMLETRGYTYRLVGRQRDAVHLLIWRRSAPVGE